MFFHSFALLRFAESAVEFSSGIAKMQLPIADPSGTKHNWKLRIRHRNGDGRVRQCLLFGICQWDILHLWGSLHHRCIPEFDALIVVHVQVNPTNFKGMLSNITSIRAEDPRFFFFLNARYLVSNQQDLIHLVDIGHMLTCRVSVSGKNFVRFAEDSQIKFVEPIVPCTIRNFNLTNSPSEQLPYPYEPPNESLCDTPSSWRRGTQGSWIDKEERIAIELTLRTMFCCTILF
jgi:hypothetical protein